MVRVAIQGEKGAYSECAALDFFRGQPVEIVPQRDYADLFECLKDGGADCMAIPIENSSAGSVFPYYDLMLAHTTSHGFRIAGELKLRIRHNLIAHPDAEISGIQRVQSHYQALDQCAGFLRSRGMTAQTVYDTAGAAKEIARQRILDVAAIASVQAAHDLGLKILARDIQDRSDNYTRFLLVDRGREPLPVPDPVKASVVFCIPNEQGSLFRAMAPFGTRRDVSVIRIESRPLTGTSSAWRKFARARSGSEDEGVWDLLYFIDFTAPAAKYQAVLDHLRDLVLEKEGALAMQVMGYYPVGQVRDITGELWRK